jgi:hypothetical protein
MIYKSDIEELKKDFTVSNFDAVELFFLRLRDLYDDRKIPQEDIDNLCTLFIRDRVVSRGSIYRKKNVERKNKLSKKLLKSLYTEYPQFKGDYKILKKEGVITITPIGFFSWELNSVSLALYFGSLETTLKLRWPVVEQAFKKQNLRISYRNAIEITDVSEDYEKIKEILKNSHSD